MPDLKTIVANYNLSRIRDEPEKIFPRKTKLFYRTCAYLAGELLNPSDPLPGHGLEDLFKQAVTKEHVQGIDAVPPLDSLVPLDIEYVVTVAENAMDRLYYAEYRAAQAHRTVPEWLSMQYGSKTAYRLFKPHMVVNVLSHIHPNDGCWKVQIVIHSAHTFSALAQKKPNLARIKERLRHLSRLYSRICP